MKFAVLISGGLRSYQETIPSLLNVFNKYDVDYFLIFNNDELEDDINKVKELLKPKVCKTIESLEDCNNMNMWYKIQQSYECFKTYMTENNVQYDLVFRSRYDNYFTNTYDFNQINFQDNVLYSGIANTLSFRVVQFVLKRITKFQNDNFFFGTPKSMEKYFNFFDIVKDSQNKCLKHIYSEVDLYNLSSLYYDETKILPIQVYLHKFYLNTYQELINKIKAYPTHSRYIFRKVAIILIVIVFCITLYSTCPRN